MKEWESMAVSWACSSTRAIQGMIWGAVGGSGALEDQSCRCCGGGGGRWGVIWMPGAPLHLRVNLGGKTISVDDTYPSRARYPPQLEVVSAFEVPPGFPPPLFFTISPPSPPPYGVLRRDFGFMGDMLPRKKSANKIFVGGLHWETTDEKLRKHFTIFGEVTDAVVMKDPVSRRSRGFGFITFADAISVDRVLSQDNHILDSRRVEAKRAVPRSETLKDPTPPTPPSRGLNLGSAGIPPGLLSATAAHQFLAPLPPPYQTTNPGVPASNKIFVGGLHYETKDVEFRQYFENFGRVMSAEVMFNRETHKSRGFGFVVFEDEASVDNVLQTAQHSIDGKMVEVKRAIPRNQVASPVSAGARGLSPSFMALGGPGKGLLGHHLVGGGPTPLALEKAMVPRPGSNASYAAVLRRGGRPGMEGDLQQLTDGVGGLSLRNKQDGLALQGLGGPQNWGTIEQILDNMDGYHHHHHHHHHHIVRDAHTVLSQQHAHLFNQDPQQAAFLHAGLQQLGLDDFSLAHQQQQPSAQPPPPPSQHHQSRQTPPEMLSSSGPPTSQPLGALPSSSTSSGNMVDMYPSTSITSTIMTEPPSASNTSSSRFPFASAGQVPLNGPSANMALWGSPAFEAELMEGNAPPTHHHPPPAQHPQQSAPPPQPDQQQQWEAMLYNAARAEAASSGGMPTAASALSSASSTTASSGMGELGPEYGGGPNGYGGIYGGLSIDGNARMVAAPPHHHAAYTGTMTATEGGEGGGGDLAADNNPGGGGASHNRGTV